MTESDNFSLESRQLCPDGTCIGVIGDDGRCRECGTPIDGNSSSEVAAPPEPQEDPIEQPLGSGSGDDDLESFDDRVPCPDGTCVGIIGPDGSCGTCGERQS